MPESDGNEVEPPKQWVVEFHESESEVRGVLKDIREAHLLGEYDTVQDRLRAFAEAEPGIFKLVALAVLDVDTLYEDLEAQYTQDTAPIGELQDLCEEYSRLAEHFEHVFTERVNELRNPMPTLKRGFLYSRAANLPRLDYDLYSGQVKLCEFIHPPSQSLMLAHGIVSSTRELLEKVEENDDEIAETELDRLGIISERLNDELAALNAVAPTPDDEEYAEDREASDIYNDWSFY